MLRYALIFLVIAILAGALGVTGFAQTVGGLIWIVFLVSLGAAVLLFFLSRRAGTR